MTTRIDLEVPYLRPDKPGFYVSVTGKTVQIFHIVAHENQLWLAIHNWKQPDQTANLVLVSALHCDMFPIPHGKEWLAYLLVNSGLDPIAISNILNKQIADPGAPPDLA